MKLATSARVVNGVYYLALSTWFGAMVMMAIGAAVTFNTLREIRPRLDVPPFDHPMFAGRAPDIIAGTITGQVLHGLVVLETICALMIVVCTALQCGVLSERLIVGPVRSHVNYFRIAALVFPIVLLMLDSVFVAPKTWELREKMYNIHINESERADARGEFQKLHKLSVRISGATTLSLGIAIFLSGFALADGNRESEA